MICRMQMGNSCHPRNMPVDAPSPEQIKHLTAEIRESWSLAPAELLVAQLTWKSWSYRHSRLAMLAGPSKHYASQRGIAADAESKIMQLKEAIHGRRAVRDYRDQPVDKAAVTTLVQAAIQAPSAINQQPWAFVVIQDKALLRLYSDRAKVLCSETMDADSMPEELKAMLSDSSFNIFYNSGTLIVIYAKPIGQHPDWDCCLAAENLMLAAHEMGLGTCPIGLAWPLLDRSDVKNNLNVPFEYLPVMPIIVGYPRKPAPSVERKEPDIRCWK